MVFAVFCFVFFYCYSFISFNSILNYYHYYSTEVHRLSHIQSPERQEDIL